MTSLRHSAILTVLALAACSPRPPGPVSSPAQYLYLWTASDDETQPDFLAVLDVTEDGSRYGRLVTTLPVPGRRNVPHHTEHEMPADGRLFANGFGTGQSFVFDLTNAAQPRIASQFGDLEGYSHPHSFLRLPNGNVLATFQMRHDSSRRGHGHRRRAGGADTGWCTRAVEIGELCRRRSRAPRLQRRDRSRVRPDRDHDD